MVVKVSASRQVFIYLNLRVFIAITLSRLIFFSHVTNARESCKLCEYKRFLLGCVCTSALSLN